MKVWGGEGRRERFGGRGRFFKTVCSTSNNRFIIFKYTSHSATKEDLKYNLSRFMAHSFGLIHRGHTTFKNFANVSSLKFNITATYIIPNI